MENDTLAALFVAVLVGFFTFVIGGVVLTNLQFGEKGITGFAVKEQTANSEAVKVVETEVPEGQTIIDKMLPSLIMVVILGTIIWYYYFKSED